MANDFLLVLILLIMTPNYILMYIGGIRVGLSTLIFVANMGGIMILFLQNCGCNLANITIQTSNSS